MKTKGFTVDKAFWWANGMFVLEKRKHHAGCKSWNVRIPLVQDVRTTTYYYDAPESAMLEYLHDKHFDINGPFTVVMTVKTVDGKSHIYNVSIGEINFATKDLDDLRYNIVHPTAMNLIKKAADELEFKKVISVTSYVEEGE